MSPAALYARVSTVDKEQNPENQLFALRQYCQANEISIWREYVDKATARDLRRRTSWKRLLDDAARGRFDTVICWKLDRVFRSPKHMYDTMKVFTDSEIDFISTTQQFDTSTAHGRFVMGALALIAELESDLNAERVRAQQENKKAQGLPYARPRLETKDPLLAGKMQEMFKRLDQDEISIKAGSQELGISRSVLSRRYKDYRGKE